jgi:lipoate-protein ligase A
MPILEAEQKFRGGLLRASVTFDVLTQTVRQVWFTGDVFVSPRRLLVDLEAALKDTPLDRLEARVRSFFHGRQYDALALTPDDFVNLVRLALKLPVAASNP